MQSSLSSVLPHGVTVRLWPQPGCEATLSQMPHLHWSNFWRKLKTSAQVQTQKMIWEFMQGCVKTLKSQVEIRNSSDEVQRLCSALPIDFLVDKLVKALDAVPSVLLIIWVCGLAWKNYTRETSKNYFDNVPQLDKIYARHFTTS